MITTIAKGPQILTCKFCGWTCLRWKRLKNGTTREGWERLLWHIEAQHPQEFCALNDRDGTWYGAILGWVDDDTILERMIR